MVCTLVVGLGIVQGHSLKFTGETFSAVVRARFDTKARLDEKRTQIVNCK